MNRPNKMNNNIEVHLAGYNVDSDVLEELKKNSARRQDVTPETISAAYARISRDPRPINELRKASREEVEKARKSNSNIIFKMGHHSIAEHAVFNFDIIGISRLAVESIEHFRLNSFTEKSQRYITLDNDFVIPKEIADTPIKDEFVSIIRLQNEFYHRLNEKLIAEDARYITSLATQAQLGLTINARNLELMFRRFASQNLSEIKELSQKMFLLVQNIAPSIILFTEENDFDKRTYEELKKIPNLKTSLPAGRSQIPNKSKIQNLPAGQAGPKSKNKMAIAEEDVRLINYTADADEVLIALLLYKGADETFRDIFEKVKKMKEDEKADVVKTACKYLQLYDSALREFESIELSFDVCLSASCFAQMKRHRMATIICQDYDPALGNVVPESISEIKMGKEFNEIINKTNDVYLKINKINRDAAPYILTNSHKRRVFFKCNARELYHISRLREDQHAQWDIRNIASQMSNAAKKVMPLSMMMIGGKDKYSDIHKNMFV